MTEAAGQGFDDIYFMCATGSGFMAVIIGPAALRKRGQSYVSPD